MIAEKTVVLHASTRPEDVTRAIDAAERLRAWRPEHRIRIIVNGPAITGVTVQAPQLELSDAATVEACEVGMRSHGITVEDLQSGVTTTPAAIVALTDAQLTGAAYIRI